MIKKLRFPLLFGLTSVAVLAAGLWLIPFSGHNNIEKPVERLPGAGKEAKREIRRAWERMRYADPATGEIPAGIKFQERWFAQQLSRNNTQSRGTGAWTRRGPWNLGGRTRAIALDVNNENRILAGGVSGGIWLSEDGGNSWARKTPLNAHPGCVSVAQDLRPGKTNTWYYLSGEVYGTSASSPGAFYLGDGLFKSTDNGENWTPVTSTAGGVPHTFSSFYQSGWRVITDPTATEDVLYMATVGAIYRSANGGNSWTAVRGGSLSNYSYFSDVAITSGGVLYAVLSSDGPQKGIWRSTNGTTWVNITPSNMPANYNRIVIGINPNNENEVYFLGSTPGSGHYTNFIDSDDWTTLLKYTYVSGDGSSTGGLWEDRSANLPSVGTEFDQFACQGGYDLVVKVQPGTNHVFIGGTNAYRSTDGFSTPNNTTQIGGYKPGTFLPFFEIYPNQHPDQHDFLFLPSNPNVMFTASDGGIHRTDDANAPTVSWNSLNRGYYTTQFYTAMLEHTIAGDPLIIGGLQDNGNFITTSADPFSTWKQTVNGDGAFGAILNGKTGYVLSIQQGRVAKVAINGNGDVTAFRRIDPIGPKKADYLFINPLALDPSDENILYLPAGRHLYRQSELGAIALTGAWDSIAQGWTKYPDTLTSMSGTTEHVISAIGVSHHNPAHRVYVGTSRNRLYRIDNAHEGVPSWTTLPTPNGNATAYITCIAVDPDNADDVLVAYSNYSVYSVYRSINGGQTWLKVAGNLETALTGSGAGPAINWVSILPFPNGSRKYFCATSVGLYSADTLLLHASNQPGTQWALEGADEIGSTVVDHMDVRAADGLVLAATHGNGMFAANFLPVSSTKTPGNTLSVKIWPNPASDWMICRLPESSSEAQLRIYSNTGALCKTNTLYAQETRVPLQGLSPGVYYYDIQSGAKSARGKFVIQ
jgi:hypothetical protein